MTDQIFKKGALLFAAGAFVFASVLATTSPARAVMLHKQGGSAADGPGAVPGAELSGYYDIGSNNFTEGSYSGTTSEPSFGTAPAGADSFMTLINPASINLCAMIYVTDNSEEVGECCGCPLSPQGQENSPGLDRFSVKTHLVSNWAIPFSGSENAVGTIIVFASLPTGISVGGVPTCDPTGDFRYASGGFSLASPYAVVGSPNPLGLNGWILNNNTITASAGSFTDVTESVMADDGSGDLDEATTLETACGFIYSNDSGAGHCTCPSETLGPIVTASDARP